MVQAALALDVNGTQVGQFVAGVPAPSTSTFTVPSEVAARVFRTGFNRVAIRSLGVSRVDPNDTRPPGPLARRRNAAWPVAVSNCASPRRPGGGARPGRGQWSAQGAGDVLLLEFARSS